jgi:CDP-diacylglycerol--serine O-phosphatidyltransferase
MRTFLQRFIKQIPNGITLLNLCSGMFSVLFSVRGMTEMAASMVFLAAIFDFLDGTMARVLNAYSPLGKELDSLADLVSFGVAPALMMYLIMQQSLSSSAESGMKGSSFAAVLPFLSVLLVVCAGVRLARFNLSPSNTEAFSGLPTPANGIFFASYAQLFSIHSGKLSPLIANPWIMICLILLFSFLMVSSLPMLTIKFTSLRWKGNESRFIMLVVSLILLILLRWEAIPVIILLYMVVSPVMLYLFKPNTDRS